MEPASCRLRHVRYGDAVLTHYEYTLLQVVYSVIPVDLLSALVGLVWCFCGGLYPTLFAAVEAARLTGWEVRVLYCQRHVYICVYTSQYTFINYIHNIARTRPFKEL